MKNSIPTKTTIPELFFTDFNSWIQHVTGIKFKQPKKVVSWDGNIYKPLNK
jgi:hypothetical protein